MVQHCLKQLVLLSRSGYFPHVVISCVFYVLYKCKLILKGKKSHKEPNCKVWAGFREAAKDSAGTQDWRQ